MVEHPKYQSEGHRFDSCWEHSDFSFNPSMPVSNDRKTSSFTNYLKVVVLQRTA